MNAQFRSALLDSFPAAARDRTVPVLTAAERRRVALASLTLLEQEYVLRLAQIRADRRALLEQGASR
jgi:hypothetical protein